MSGTNLDKDVSETYNISRKFPHKEYYHGFYTNDIELIRVERDIEFNDNVQSIALAKVDFNETDNSPLTLTGWVKLK